MEAEQGCRPEERSAGQGRYTGGAKYDFSYQLIHSGQKEQVDGEWVDNPDYNRSHAAFVVFLPFSLAGGVLEWASTIGSEELL
jgi:hypothetical protein